MHFSDGFYALPESAKNAVSPTNPFLRLAKLLGYTLLRLVGNIFSGVKQTENLHGKVWLYVVSQNNIDSLSFIQNNLSDAAFVAGQSKDIGKYNKMVNRLSLRRKLLYYYKFFPLLLYFLQNRKKQAIRFYDVLYDAVGFYEVYLHQLQKYKPSCIVFANDHNADARAMLLAAKQLGIKTVYVQHASVSPIFPPLAFDLNLLEGQDALEKYKQCGPVPGKVELIGMPKADAFVPFRKPQRSVTTIGLACNLMDETAEITHLVTKLSQAFPELRIILRPHPRDSRNFKTDLHNNTTVEISDSRLVQTFDFLKELDVLISGNSGIHLEAVLLNVWAIFYNMNPSENLADYYGFIRNGLVDTAPDHPSLVKLIQENQQQTPEVYLRAQYYNATVGIPYDGKSGQLALQHLEQFLEL
ncbi:hypothetical protein [Pontibacter arcticus]|nr:hypothetical protein [Pontibacter arcticus]